MKTPAFQFYPDDWLSCEKVSVMTPECEGAYIRLLAYAWRSEDCGLPNDDSKLAILSRMGERWQCDGIAMVMPCFFVKDGRLYNKRLLEERQKQKNYRSKQSENAKLRWHKDLTSMPPHSQKDAMAIPTQCSSSSSSSSLKEYIYTLADCQKAADGIGLKKGDIESFFNYYNSVGWIDGLKRPITNLKSKLATWKADQPSHGKKSAERKRPEDRL